MAFFSEAFYSGHSSKSTPPLEPGRTSELDAEIDQTLDDAVDFLSSSDVEKLLSSSPRTDTPQIKRLFETPPSSVSRKPTSSDAKRKRVDFAPFTSTTWGWAADAGPNAQKENSSALLLRKLQPSKERSTLRSKSILKATSGRGNEQSPEMQAASRSWPQALEFGLKQLRSDRAGTRLDAWRSMQQFLSATEDVGSTEELGGKHNALLICATRDLVYTDKDHVNGLPNQLPNHTLKFLSKFVRLPNIEADLSSIAVTNLIRIMIEQLQRPDISKNLVRCYMEFLYQQNFSAEVLTSSRTKKLVEAMNDTSFRQNSSAILLDQMKVCRKFVDQSPEGMVASAPTWLGMFLRGLFSEDLAVFRVATDAAFDTAVKLGQRPEIAKALQKVFSEVGNAEDGITNFQRTQKELTEKADFAKDTTQAMLVPKMVSAILLFLRTKAPSTLLGAEFVPFVSILKPYLAKSSAITLSHAYTAWSWLIIAHTHGGRWPVTNRQMLRRPMENILTHMTVDLDFEKGTPAHVLSTYLVLLYCSFYPDTPHQAVKEKWDLYVSDILRQMLAQSKSHADVASRIICALLSSDAQWDPQLLSQIRKPWNTPMMEIKDLVRVQPSWIRSNLDSVLRLVDQVFKSPQRAEQSPLVWKALLNALAHAGDSEIRATKEAKEAVARITNYLTHLWRPYSRKDKDIVLFGQMLEQLLDESCRVIFAEKILRKASHGNDFEVVTTPSHRSTVTQHPISAMQHFLDLLIEELVEQCTGLEADQSQDNRASALCETIRRLTRQICARETSLLAKVRLLSNQVRNLLQKKRSRGVDDKYVYLNQLCRHGLEFIQDLIVKSDSYELGRSESLEQGYHHLTSMMTDVACYTSHLSSTLSPCYHAIMNKALADIGPAGALLCVTEASARNIHQFFRNNDNVHQPAHDSTLPDFAQIIVATTPSSVASADVRRALERFGKGSSQSSAKKAELHEVYHMLNHVLAFAYDQLLDNEGTRNAFTLLVDTISKVLRRQNANALTHIKIMQSGITAVVADRKGRIFDSKKPSPGSDLVHDLWKIILSKHLFDQQDRVFFMALEQLISAGLSSRSSRIVNESVQAWNNLYGSRSDLVYPSGIAKAIRKLKALDVDIKLSSPLPPQDNEEPDSPLVIESIEPSALAEDVLVPPTPRPIQQSSHLTASPTPAMPSRRRPASVTPRGKPQPRHEDSQIQFEPIPSSPLPQSEPELLTERQIEVAERQRKGAATLFAEASSPAASRLRQLSAELPEDEPVVPSPSTPLLAPTMDDAIPSSSPVVASVKRRESSFRRMAPPEVIFSTGMVDFQDELPSSPPAMDDERPMRRLGSIPMVTLTSHRNEPLEQQKLGSSVTTSQPESHQTVGAASGSKPRAREILLFNSKAHRSSENLEATKALTGASATQSFNSILSIPALLTESSSTRVQDSFPARTSEEPQIDSTEASFVDQSLEDNQDPIPESFSDDAQASDLHRRKRKRVRAAFTMSKRKKGNEGFAYNTSGFIRFKRKTSFIPPNDMLPTIAVKAEDEPTTELPNDQDLDRGVELPAPTFTKTRRGRSHRSQDHRNNSQSRDSLETALPRKRGRSSLRSQEMDATGTDFVPTRGSIKRPRTGPRTPPSRERSASSATHYVEITPGNEFDRRGSRSTRTDTPEAEAILSQLQHIPVSNDPELEQDSVVVASTYDDVAGTSPHVIDTQAAQGLALMPPVSHTIVPEADKLQKPVSLQADELVAEAGPVVDRMSIDYAPVRNSGRPPSIAPSLASSQTSRSSQMSSFSVSAFKGVMSRFVDQIKEFVKGGSHQATEEAATAMANEANKTVEKLARAVRKNRTD